jgi:hypothetical protein
VSFILVASVLTEAADARAPAAASVRTVSFSGYSWAVKSSSDVVGPGPNRFSDSARAVWVDTAGQLHLRMTHNSGGWSCAEVTLTRSLGYGTYRFSVASPIEALDPNVVLGLFTWSDDPAYSNREIDVEFARWADPFDLTNAQYVVQPADRAGHLSRFAEPALLEPSIHSFSWGPARVSFASAAGSGQPIAAWTYAAADVPRPGGEHVHINLWLDKGLAPTNGAEVEVVLSRFSFTPR